MTSPIKDNIRVFINNVSRFIRKRKIYHNFNFSFLNSKFKNTVIQEKNN